MAKQCSNCGTMMADGDTFCGFCGARESGVTPSPIAQVPSKEGDGGGKGFLVAGGAAAVIAVVIVVVVCLCLVCVVALGLGFPAMGPTPTPTRPAPTRTPLVVPTRTTRPAPTATRGAGASPTAPSTTGAYTDDFSKEGSWKLGPSSNGNRWLENGELNVIVEQANYVVWSRLQGYEYGDLTVEVDARVVKGSGGNYGLLFRVEDDDNFYRFVIGTDGRYRVMKLVNRSWSSIKSWTSSSAIKTGADTNRLKVVAQGTSITVYANGQELTTVTDSALARGEVALVAAAGSTADFQVAFDNLEVRP